MSEPFIGEIRIFGFNYAPRGWAMCNGQLIPISQNTALFALLGLAILLPSLGRAQEQPPNRAGLIAACSRSDSQSRSQR